MALCLIPCLSFLWEIKYLPSKPGLRGSDLVNFLKRKKNFHYQLSRARRFIEYTFGILAAKWKIYHSLINSLIEIAESYVLATIALYKCVRLTYNAAYTPVALSIHRLY